MTAVRREMEKLRQKEHDFSAKLRQESIIERFRDYVTWQRRRLAAASTQDHPEKGPVSINLDLTAACNYSCPHCVDSGIINTGRFMKTEVVKKTVDTLQSGGLLSIILVGGGEPTLHKDFEEIVRFIKNRGLQLGIVTNGSRLGSVIEAAGVLEIKDWVRISLDAAKEDTYVKLHRPKNRVTLQEILRNAQKLKTRNPRISLGYSFVIVWEGIQLNGHELCPNTTEMSEAVRMAGEYGFDYISFKPCLVRLEDSQKESLLDNVKREKEKAILKEIKSSLEKAKKAAEGKVKILESVNLRAMLNNRVSELKRQPKTCHMQFFSSVVTPSGIFHCPAFRGVEKVKIAGPGGYAGKSAFDKTLQNVDQSLTSFDAEQECSVVGCFYNHVNWWIENFILSNKSVDDLEKIEDDNFFL